jgi:hypothetical protein
MNIQDLGSLGEFIGAVAVVVSLVYLAIQIRQNTRALRGTFHDSHVNRMQAWQMAVASDPDLVSIWQRAARGDALTEAERERLSFLRNYFLIGTESVFHQFARGNIDPEVWEAHRARVRRALMQPEFRQWFRDGQRFTFTESFEAFFEAEIEAIERKS